MAKITSLPTELLVEIITKISHESYEGYIRNLKNERQEGDPRLCCPYSWLPVTHVCRAWRSVTINCPLLWTKIAVIKADATRELVGRSGSQKLSISARLVNTFNTPLDGGLAADEIGNRITTFMWLFRTHTSRIETLVMPTVLELFHDSIAKDLTQLRSLVLVNPHLPLNLPSDAELPASDFPLLEHLECKSLTHTSIAQLFCSTLKTLIVRPDRQTAPDDDDDEHLVTTIELSRALATMPLLEVLDVHLSDDLHTITTVAHLPKLRFLRLVGGTIACAQLFDCLRLPGDVKVSFDCKMLENGNGFLESALMVLYTAFVTPSAANTSNLDPIVSFSLQDVGGYYEMYGWRTPQAFVDGTVNKHLADVSVVCHLYDEEQEFTKILSVFNLRNVQYLRIGKILSRFDYTRICIDTFTRCENLRTLCVDGLVAPWAVGLASATTATDIILANINLRPANVAKAAQWLYSRTSGECISRQLSWCERQLICFR